MRRCRPRPPVRRARRRAASAMVSGTTATPDVAHPLAGPHVCGLEEVGRHRLGQPFPLGPRRRPLLVVPSLRLGFVGHGDTVPGAGRFGAVRVGLVILPTDRWREARRQWEWADAVGFAHGVDLRPHPLGRHAGGPVARGSAGAGGRRRGDRARPAGHARRHPELPPPGDAGPRGAGPRRRERAVASTSGWVRAARGSTRPLSGRSRGRRRNGWRVSRSSCEVLRPILDGEPTARTSVRTAHYAADEAPSTPGSAAAAPSPSPSPPEGPKGMRLAALHGRHWVTIGPTGTDSARRDAMLEAVRRQVPLLEDACRVGGPGPVEHRQGPAVDADRAACSSRRTSSTSWSPPTSSWASTSSSLHHPAQTGPYGGDVAAFERIAERATPTA